ncbi:hypothetical protein [uncultured Clostridium sp.]|uniref:hypothetical protein n=1 Tax=uncultured Clostridium sp. TaxID=59620 RepID=UPI002618EA00|nr:hypothetical protein [uncultured Clostridium sp.]
MKVEKLLIEKDKLLKIHNSLYEKLLNKLEELKLTAEGCKNKLEYNNKQIENLRIKIDIIKEENRNYIKISEKLKSDIMQLQGKKDIKIKLNVEKVICTNKSYYKEEIINNRIDLKKNNSNIGDTLIWKDNGSKKKNYIYSYRAIINAFNSDNFERARLIYNKIIFKNEAIKSFNKYQNITLLFVGYILKKQINQDNIKEYKFIKNNFNIGKNIESILYEKLSEGVNLSSYLEKYRNSITYIDPKVKGKILKEIINKD